MHAQACCCNAEWLHCARLPASEPESLPGLDLGQDLVLAYGTFAELLRDDSKYGTGPTVWGLISPDFDP